ncbi:uncharacterized protein CDV56_107104 [Aspergillus thermomutatus]|uniref:Phosphatidylinositol-specific phospholipase C X domain-containing protein n=1 Tax=Aspergillus thermomutatus TaxID=41047 RepID=A0A397HQ76_ASPTH|nr:uncharacterized protein CDV56_107104 [Aspergillus thermomutatus]RHZ65182.1 hypothetical protein CDV56_107104 [Aspergillus thermomutatus]
MRPALLRLLKRPSAVSVLDSLISTSTGIEQLESKYKCLRCSSRKAHQNAGVRRCEVEQPGSNESPTRLNPSSTSRPFSFQVSSVAEKDTSLPLDLQPDKLSFESDIGHTQDIGTRLVDDPSHRQRLDLWEQLLRYRQRHYGDRGTLDIWVALTDRVDGVDLPVVGEQADLFWHSFIDLGLKREVIMGEVLAYALELWKRTGSRWDKFYEVVVGGYLERALTMSNESTKIVLATTATRRSVSPGISAFKNICRLTEGHQIYGCAISRLLQMGRVEDALSLHSFLVERHDHPQTYEEIRPLLRCAKELKPRKFYEKLQAYSKDRFPDRAASAEESGPAKEDDTRESSGKAWLQEKPFKDELGARLFATKALTLETTIAGLRMFGVQAIGPQSLREMAIRAQGSQDLVARLRELQRAGISIGDSVFARLIRRLASENRDILLSDLLHSDQHPDVLEDAGMQESLLISYYIARDWRPYNMTLAILGEIFDDRSKLFNIHFRKFIASGEWASASKVVDEMTLSGQKLAQESVDFMVKHTLTPRRPGVGPVQGTDLSSNNEVSFVFRVLQRAVPMGTSVSPGLWIEMLKRLGMTNHWDELRGCCLWLARQYSGAPKPSDAASLIITSTEGSRREAGGVPLGDGDRMLQAVFSKNMQAAIVAWGFKMRVSPNPNHKGYRALGLENLVPWVRGLVLLRELEHNGIRLWRSWIRRACRHRLAVLYGHSRHSSRHMNRLGVLALLPLTSATALLPRETACNNSPSLCSKSYGEITHLGAHDSPFVRDASTGYSTAANQYYNTTLQLDAGVRMVTAQVHSQDSEWHLCHSSCELLDAGKLSTWLKEIKSWLDSNPNDVVTVLLVNSDSASASDLNSEFETAGIVDYAYKPSSSSAPSSWPTLQTLINNGTRLMVFVASLDSNTDAPYLMDEFSLIWESPYQVTSPSNFSCNPDRPTSVKNDLSAALSSNRLPLMNHFLYATTILNIEYPNSTYVSTTNAPSGGVGNLGDTATKCRSAYGRQPAFILVDFFDKGPAIDTVDNLNNVTSPVGRTNLTTSSSTTATTQTSSASTYSNVFKGLVELVQQAKSGANPGMGDWVWVGGDWGSLLGGGITL